jgi:23S rRNA (cytosine1962-C5)-methyltransferase
MPKFHMKKGIVTARGYQNLTSGHPWVKAADLENADQFGSRPSLVQLGEHWFFHSPASALRLRRFGPLTREWLFAEAKTVIGAQTSLTDPSAFKKIFGGWLAEHFGKLLADKRELVLEPNDDLCLRWIFSENDLIPGLTVDIFGDIAIAEINSAPLETFWYPIKEALENTLKPLGVKLVESRDNQIRKKEGLETIAAEKKHEPRWLKWNGFEILTEPGGPQKTGLYLDQKFNHRVAAEWAKRLNLQNAYDVFCFQGGFALHLAKVGLTVTGIDQSAAALKVAAQNSQRNNLKVEWVEADAFNWLKHLTPNAADLIVLDPPSLVTAKNNMENSLRALTHLHADALKALRPGGLLVTCTCSQALTDDVLTKVLRESGQQTRRTLNILEKRGPSADHPVLPNFPEGDYLRAWYVRA